MIKSIDELSIKKYRQLIELNRDDYNEMEYGLEILSILSDIPVDELLDLPIDDFTSMMAQTIFLKQTFEKVDYESLGKTLKINGKEYTLIRKAKDLTAGQYIDYKSYCARDKFMEMLPYIMTVFIIPKGCKYNQGYDIVELANEFDEHMNIPLALGISDFFLHQSRKQMMASVLCSKLKIQRMMKKEKNKEMKMKLQDCLEQMDSLWSLLKLSDGFIQQ